MMDELVRPRPSDRVTVDDETSAKHGAALGCLAPRSNADAKNAYPMWAWVAIDRLPQEPVPKAAAFDRHRAECRARKSGAEPRSI